MFSKRDFKEQLSEMMLELKESFSLVKTSGDEDDNTNSKNNSTEGGELRLDKNELIAKYGIDVNTLDFSIDDYSIEELEEKFKLIKDTASADDSGEDKFALMSTVFEEVIRALGEEKIQREWGESSRYLYVDLDTEVNEVYCWDTTDWLLYGFTYEMRGDNVDIDFSCKKRKKYVIADFDEGEQASPFAEVFAQLEQEIKDRTGSVAEMEAKYQTASETITSMETELDELRKFKSDTEAAAAQSERDEVFAQFEDLTGVEAFEELKENCDGYDIEALEEKCYAIRGRQTASAKFALDPAAKAPKIKVEKENTDTAPYGGLFERYKVSEEN